MSPTSTPTPTFVPDLTDFGAIALARLPFTDLTGDKRRPALVVSIDNERRSDIIVCFITPVSRVGPEAVTIPHTVQAGLKLPSVVRFDKLATLERLIITGQIGVAPPVWLSHYARVFLSVFGFSKLASL